MHKLGATDLKPVSLSKLFSPSSGEPQVTSLIALDCEMFEVDYQRSALGRVSIINSLGQCLYDTFVKPQDHQQITDLRTDWSGITYSKLKTAVPFEDAQFNCLVIMSQATKIVGHTLINDLKVLEVADDAGIRSKV